MDILDATIFAPGNIHARCRVIALQIGDAAGRTVSPQAIADLARALQRVRPVVLDCPAWRRLIQARKPVPLAAAVEVLAIVTQRYLYWPVKFCSWRERPSRSHPGRTDQSERQGLAIYEIGAEMPGRAAGDAALALAELLSQPEGATTDLFTAFLAQMAAFQARTVKETPAGDALQIAEAAAQRGIAWSVLHRSQFMRLGLGRQSHILKGSESTHTASISRALARDKSMTNRILSQAGLPVARQVITTSAKRAAILAEQIGYPLVVKPRDGNMGKGITIGVTDAGHLARAFQRAQKVSRHVALESLLTGEEYRLLVIDGQFVAAAHRRAAQVSGDGRRTIAQLVKAENQRPEREPVLISRMAILRQLEMDENAHEVLAEQGMDITSVPEAGQIVYLRRESNISRGGEAVDITDSLHPENARMAARVARTMGLDICGIDFISPDPSVPWNQNGAAICEVNSRPGIIMQIHMAGKQSHRITDPILNMYFPDDRPSRMPVVVLLGHPSETAPLREWIETAAAHQDRVLGLLGRLPGKLPATRQLQDAAALAWDNDIQIAVIEATPDQVIRRGLGLERVDLALVGSDGDMAMGAAREVLSRAASAVLDLNDPAALEQIGTVLGLTIADQPAQPDAPAASPAGAAARAHDTNAFTALFLGDVGFGESYMHHPRTKDLQRVLGMHGHGYSLANLHGLLGLGDLTVANLEVPLSTRPDPALQGRKNYLGWSDPDRTVAALQSAGIYAVTLANNHMLDCGTAGLSETLARLQSGGVQAFGAGDSQAAADHPLIHRFHLGGKERALVVFAGFEYRRRYDRRYRWYARGGRGGVGLLSPDIIAGNIAQLRKVLPDPLFVAFPHWGTDYADITDSQRETAQGLVDAGIDLVIGHGAHILQPIEMIDRVPVLFNIGNFIWNTPGRFNKRDVLPMGAAVSLTFQQGARGGPRLRLYPIITDNDITGFQNRPVDETEFAQAARFLTAQMPGRPRRLRDEVGFHLDMPLRPRPAHHPSPEKMAAE